MALQVAYTTDQGFVCDAAYVAITQLKMSNPDLAPASFYVSASVFKDKAACDAGLDPVGIIESSFVLDISDGAPNIYAQAYTNLKSLPSLSGAIDV